MPRPWVLPIIGAPPSPPSGGTVRFYSDWRTGALGSSTAAHMDGSKWPSVSREGNASVVAAPSGMGWPCHRVHRVSSPDGAFDCWHRLDINPIVNLAIGEYRTWRWLFSYRLDGTLDYSEGGFEEDFHGIGDNQAEGSRNWDLTASYIDGGAGWGFALRAGSTRWGIWDVFEETTRITALTRFQPYRFETKVLRVDSGNYRFFAGVWDMAGTRIVSESNLYNDVGSQTLAQFNTGGGTIPINTLSGTVFGTFHTGHNGIDPPYPSFPVDHSDQAAFAIVDGLGPTEWIGNYGNGTVPGEVPV